MTSIRFITETSYDYSSFDADQGHAEDIQRASTGSMPPSPNVQMPKVTKKLKFIKELSIKFQPLRAEGPSLKSLLEVRSPSCFAQTSHLSISKTRAAADPPCKDAALDHESPYPHWSFRSISSDVSKSQGANINGSPKKQQSIDTIVDYQPYLISPNILRIPTKLNHQQNERSQKRRLGRIMQVPYY